MQRAATVGSGMTADEWLDKRGAMAETFGVPASEVPAEVVWFVVWPQPEPSTEAIARARELAAEYGWNSGS